MVFLEFRNNYLYFLLFWKPQYIETSKVAHKKGESTTKTICCVGYCHGDSPNFYTLPTKQPVWMKELHETDLTLSFPKTPIILHELLCHDMGVYLVNKDGRTSVYWNNNNKK